MSKADARQTATRLTKEDGVEMDAYKCPYQADTWHIGHHRQPDLPAETREDRRAALDAKRARLERQKGAA